MIIGRREVINAAGAAILARAAPAPAAPPPGLSPADFEPVVTGIDGAEGLAIAADGSIFFSRKGGVAVRRPDGTVGAVGQAPSPAGLALDSHGRVIVANVGLLHGTPGPLLRIDPASGAVETLVAALDGRTLVASNAPAVARDGTIYCSHSKWDGVQTVGSLDPQGFVYMVRPDGRVAIVARGLAGANGCCLDPAERHLYLVLTPEARIVRFRRHADGTLGPRENYGPVLGETIAGHTVAAIRAMPAGARARLGYADGVAFDEAGDLWVSLPFADRLVAITRDGRVVTRVNDRDARAIAMPTNFAWGGADRRWLYVVSRASGSIVRARTLTAGVPTP